MICESEKMGRDTWLIKTLFCCEAGEHIPQTNGSQEYLSLKLKRRSFSFCFYVTTFLTSNIF